MSLEDNWTSIIPRHGKVLRVLREQRGKDLYGSIGWGGLRDTPERFSDKALFDPLLERGLIEKCTAYRPAGHLFARVTDFGLTCLTFGLMPKRPIEGAMIGRYHDEALEEMKKREENKG